MSKSCRTVTPFDGSPVQTFSYVAGATAFSETHQYLDDNPSGTGSDTYSIKATLADDDSGSDMATVNVTVNNVAPAIKSLASSASNVGDAREGQLVTISGAFTDIGTLDTHTATIDWGDGKTSEATITESNGSGLIAGSHKYISGGIYDVKVSLPIWGQIFILDFVFGICNDKFIGGPGTDTLNGGSSTNILIDSTPSWVRQFVVDLATYGLDPNGDISVVIPSSLEPQLPSG